MRRALLTATTLALLLPAAAEAQRRYYDDRDAEGAESCREIWREFGRNMSGRPRAYHCEIKDLGVMPKPDVLEFDGGSYTGARVLGAKRSDVRVRLVIQAQSYTVAEARELAKNVTMDLKALPLRIDGISRPRDRDRDDDERVSAVAVFDTPDQTNLRLSVRYGPMDVENVVGRMDLRAAYGPLNMKDVGGDVRARVDYGPLEVELAGNKWQGTGLDAEAAYGPMTLRVPRNFGAELEIGADHGPIDVDFPLTLRRFDRSLIETKLGDGGPRIRAVARYGPMSLKMTR
jgi:hypothetical protein